MNVCSARLVRESPPGFNGTGRNRSRAPAAPIASKSDRLPPILTPDTARERGLDRVICCGRSAPSCDGCFEITSGSSLRPPRARRSCSKDPCSPLLPRRHRPVAPPATAGAIPTPQALPGRRTDTGATMDHGRAHRFRRRLRSVHPGVPSAAAGTRKLASSGAICPGCWPTCRLSGFRRGFLCRRSLGRRLLHSRYRSHLRRLPAECSVTAERSDIG